MSEFHPEAGLTRQDYYRLELAKINSKFDKKIENKSFFESKTEIEEMRHKELKELDQIYSKRS